MIYNQEAEQALLGAIINHNDLIAHLSIEELDFAFISHQKIFVHIAGNLRAGLPANLINLKDFFSTLDEGKDYLNTLSLSVSATLLPSETHKILRDLRNKRKLEEIALELKEMSSDATKNSQEIKDFVSESLEELNLTASAKKTLTLSQAVRRSFKSRGSKIIYSGYPSLDQITGGFEDGDLIILAGRPGMGKSALGVSIALKLAKENIGVLIISLEMSQEQVARRIIANLGSLNVAKLKYNSLSSQAEVEFFQKAVERADELPIFLNDEGSITLAKIKYEIKKHVKKGVRLVMIDYIQLIKHQTRGGMTEKITEISNALKAMAMEFGVVILGLSQLNRALESREDKRPQLSDLRDSGAIEQDANMVIFAFRPEYYLERQKPEDPARLSEWQKEMERLRGLAFAIVSKNRDGQCGEARLRFDGEFARFTENTNF